jgi:hypothetical protein
MNELEMCKTLGILFDPEMNKVSLTQDLIDDIIQVCNAFSEITHQKERYGSVNQDLWLEFIPWHSLN